MVDFWQVLKNRHCIRNFDSHQPVTNQQLKKIIQAAEMAPSAGNLKDWHFEVIKKQEIKDQLAQAALDQDFIAQAPVVIVICADLEKAATGYGSRGVNLYCIQDSAAATQNLFLAATALGLGTCWVGAFDETQVREILNLKLNLRPVVIMPVGYSR